jgi:hypothetical protein
MIEKYTDRFDQRIVYMRLSTEGRTRKWLGILRVIPHVLSPWLIRDPNNNCIQGRNVELHSQVNQNILLSSANTLVSFLFWVRDTSDGDCRKG